MLKQFRNSPLFNLKTAQLIWETYSLLQLDKESLNLSTCMRHAHGSAYGADNDSVSLENYTMKYST